MSETSGEIEAPPAPLPSRRGMREFIQRNSGLVFGGLLFGILIFLIAGIVVNRGATEAGNQIVVGLSTGGIYALVAVGYTMVYGIIELINFAHGDVFTLSAYYATFLAAWLGLGKAAAGGLSGVVLAIIILFPLTMALTGATGVVIERVVYRPLRDAPRVSLLIAAIGLSFFIEGVMYAFFPPPKACTNGVGTGVGAIGGNYNTCNSDWIHGVAFRIGRVPVEWKDLFVVVAALVLMFALRVVIQRTRLGKAMRATAQDRDAALVCGININRTIAATFFIGSALAAAGGMIYSMYYGLISWNLGYRFGIIAFTAAVLGGIGNIVGAGLGGFLIGLISVIASELLGGAWADSVAFGVLILVLTIRPRGLLGSQVADRA